MPAMRYRKLYLTVFTILILTIVQSTANLLILFETSQILAQTPPDRKAEADRLLQQGFEQLERVNLQQHYGLGNRR